MDFIISAIIACLIAIPYRHFKMRYKLATHDDSENCFYGSDEMAEAYKNKLNPNDNGGN